MPPLWAAVTYATAEETGWLMLTSLRKKLYLDLEAGLQMGFVAFATPSQRFVVKTEVTDHSLSQTSEMASVSEFAHALTRQ